MKLKILQMVSILRAEICARCVSKIGMSRLKRGQNLDDDDDDEVC